MTQARLTNKQHKCDIESTYRSGFCSRCFKLTGILFVKYNVYILAMRNQIILISQKVKQAVITCKILQSVVI